MPRFGRNRRLPESAPVIPTTNTRITRPTPQPVSPSRTNANRTRTAGPQPVPSPVNTRGSTSTGASGAPTAADQFGRGGVREEEVRTQDGGLTSGELAGSRGDAGTAFQGTTQEEMNEALGLQEGSQGGYSTDAFQADPMPTFGNFRPDAMPTFGDGPAQSANQGYANDAIAKLLQGGVRNTAEEEALIQEMMRASAGTEQANLNARMAAGGFGTSGALSSMTGDLQRMAAREAAEQIMGLRAGARDEHRQDLGMGLDSEFRGRQLDSDNFFRDRGLDQDAYFTDRNMDQDAFFTDRGMDQDNYFKDRGMDQDSFYQDRTLDQDAEFTDRGMDLQEQQYAEYLEALRAINDVPSDLPPEEQEPNQIVEGTGNPANYIPTDINDAADSQSELENGIARSREVGSQPSGSILAYSDGAFNYYETSDGSWVKVRHSTVGATRQDDPNSARKDYLLEAIRQRGN